MNNIETAQDIISYGVSLSTIGAINFETGLLTREPINRIEQEDLLDLSKQTESILRQIIDQYVQVWENGLPSGHDCSTLFQYVFDKVVEVGYKKITGAEIDTQFLLREPFEFHYPDLPEYIQIKLTNVVGNIASLNNKILAYIIDNEYNKLKTKHWLLPFLLVAAFVGFEFAQEMELSDYFDNEI